VKAAAQRRWHQLMTGRGSGAQATPQVPVPELTAMWLDTKNGLSERGYEACENAAVRLDRAWGDALPGDLAPSRPAAWVAGLGGSSSGRAKIHQCLRGAPQLVVADGMIEANPAVGIRVGADQPREPRFLHPGQLAALATAAGPHPPDEHAVATRGPHGRTVKTIGLARDLARDTAMVWLLGTTGPRIGKACALSVGDVDVARRRLRIHRSKNGTAASPAIAAGAGVKAVQRMLGHRSATMTLDLYGHRWDEHSSTKWQPRWRVSSMAADPLPNTESAAQQEGCWAALVGDDVRRRPVPCGRRATLRPRHVSGAVLVRW